VKYRFLDWSQPTTNGDGRSSQGVCVCVCVSAQREAAYCVEGKAALATEPQAARSDKLMANERQEG